MTLAMIIQANYRPILTIAFITLVGACFGHTLIGATVGVGFVLFVTVFF